MKILAVLLFLLSTGLITSVFAEALDKPGVSYEKRPSGRSYGSDGSVRDQPLGRVYNSDGKPYNATPTVRAPATGTSTLPQPLPRANPSGSNSGVSRRGVNSR